MTPIKPLVTPPNITYSNSTDIKPIKRKDTKMNLEIKEIKELDNGGAELIIDMDATTQTYLINFAILELIKRGLYEVRELHEAQVKEDKEKWEADLAAEYTDSNA